ncbi:hypothetical protein [Streptomyces sp. NPDC057939]|uniref:hypothetical protein n=1 Tax=Streptomyces sp. NPDC057939 TaxID=3346284 RepID=UPI0036EC4083
MEEADQARAFPGLDGLDAQAAAALYALLVEGEPDEPLFGPPDEEEEAWASFELTAEEKDHQALVARLIRDGEAMREELGLPGFPAPENSAKDFRTPVPTPATDPEENGAIKEEPSAAALVPGRHRPPYCRQGPRRQACSSCSGPVTADGKPIDRYNTVRLSIDAFAMAVAITGMVLMITGALDEGTLVFSSMMAVVLLNVTTPRRVIRVVLHRIKFHHDSGAAAHEDHRSHSHREKV